MPTARVILGKSSSVSSPKKAAGAKLRVQPKMSVLALAAARKRKLYGEESGDDEPKPRKVKKKTKKKAKAVNPALALVRFYCLPF